MKRMDLVNRYLNVFFNSQEFDSLHTIFHENLVFNGPFINTENAKQYVDLLKNDVWEKCDYEMVEQYENTNSICINYRFKKSGKSTLMSQLFWFSKGRISKIRLIFNAEEIR